MHRSTAFPAAAPHVVRAGELAESTAQTAEALRRSAVSRDAAGATAIWPGRVSTKLLARTAAEALRRVVCLNTNECSYASLPGRPCEP